VMLHCSLSGHRVRAAAASWEASTRMKAGAHARRTTHS